MSDSARELQERLNTSKARLRRRIAGQPDSDLEEAANALEAAALNLKARPVTDSRQVLQEAETALAPFAGFDIGDRDGPASFYARLYQSEVRTAVRVLARIRASLAEGDLAPTTKHDPHTGPCPTCGFRIHTVKACRETTPADALAAIAAERQRQINVEGFTAEHDHQHRSSELARAAACYCAIAGNDDDTRAARLKNGWLPATWPWDWSWWKPKDRRRDLVRAGALIVAEIERLDTSLDGRNPQ